MINLFFVLAGAEFAAVIISFSLIGIILWLIGRSFPAPVIPTDEDEIVGDASTLRRGFCPAYPATLTPGQE